MSWIHVHEKARSSMLIPCSHGQLQRVVYMHVIERLIKTVFWRAFFFHFFPCVSFLLFIFQLKFVAAYVMVCSWLGVVRAMMFNRGILFYSKWPFGQSQHIKKKSNLSHWWTVHTWIEWTNAWIRSKRESSSKVHQRGARMPGLAS